MILRVLTQIPKKPTHKTAEATISNLIQLHALFPILEQITETIESCECSLLKSVHESLSQEAFGGIKKSIEASFETDSHPSAKAKKKRNDLVLWSKFCAIVDDIQNTFDFLQTHPDYGAPGMQLKFNVQRGYHISLPLMSIEDLPKIFIHKSRYGKRILCSTAQLVSLEQRREDIFNEIMTLTSLTLNKLLEEIRSHMHLFHAMSENLALLDMLISFDTYSRPFFTKDGPIALKKAKHPILEALSEYETVGNDLYISESSNFHLIFGPNASGKSTYLKQTGLLIVLSHIGMYCPAEYASFRIVDHLMTRISHSDELLESATLTSLRTKVSR